MHFQQTHHATQKLQRTLGSFYLSLLLSFAKLIYTFAGASLQSICFLAPFCTFAFCICQASKQVFANLKIFVKPKLKVSKTLLLGCKVVSKSFFRSFTRCHETNETKHYRKSVERTMNVSSRASTCLHVDVFTDVFTSVVTSCVLWGQQWPLRAQSGNLSWMRRSETGTGVTVWSWINTKRWMKRTERDKFEICYKFEMLRVHVTCP